jgi:hypothetical protein
MGRYTDFCLSVHGRKVLFGNNGLEGLRVDMGVTATVVQTQDVISSLELNEPLGLCLLIKQLIFNPPASLCNFSSCHSLPSSACE